MTDADAAPPPPVIDTDRAGSRIIRGSALRVVGHGVGLLIAVGSSAVLNRHLGLVGAGRYVTVLSLALLAAGLSDAGLASIGVREHAVRHGRDGDEFLRTLVTVRAALTVCGMLVACAYAQLAGFGPTLVLGTAIAGAGVVLTTLQTSMSTVLITDLRLGWVALADGVRQLVGALVVVALVVLGAELLPFFATTAVGALASLLLTIAVVRRLSLLRPALDGRVLRSISRDALPFAAATAVAALYLRVGVLVVALAGNEQETGYYSVSFRVVEALVAIPVLAVGTAFPVFARTAGTDVGRHRHAVQRTFEVALLFGTGIAVVTAVGAPVAIEVVGGGGAFAPAGEVLRLHSVALGLSFASPVVAYALLSLRAHHEVLVMSVAGLAVMLVGSLLGAELVGARGAAVAAAAGALALLAVGWLALRRRGLRLELGVVGRLPVAALAAALPALVLPALPAAVIAAALFTVTALVVGAVPDELGEELRRITSGARAAPMLMPREPAP